MVSIIIPAYSLERDRADRQTHVLSGPQVSALIMAIQTMAQNLVKLELQTTKFHDALDQAPRCLVSEN